MSLAINEQATLKRVKLDSLSNELLDFVSNFGSFDSISIL